MKRIFFAVFSILFLLTFSSCDNNKKATSDAEENTIENKLNNDENKKTETKPESFYKVNVGLKPDLMYKDTGFKIDSVVPDRPGKYAGLMKGDIITKINDAEVKDLNSYTMFMSNFHNGDTVLITFTRDNNKLQTNLILD
ncbi:MAG: PDZ domain-containing protein [Saprospiraceae bacterium]